MTLLQGLALAEELARRLGKERCYRVSWPDGCKDANDVLQNLGEATLRGSIDNAEGFPLRGLAGGSFKTSTQSTLISSSSSARLNHHSPWRKTYFDIALSACPE